MLTMSALGKRGGKTTLARYGKSHLVEVGRKGGCTTKARHGLEHYRTMRQTPEQRATALEYPRLCATANALACALTGRRRFTLREMVDAMPLLGAKP